MKKLPFMQFYPGDWMKDPALRSCSPATRGIWMDMLCLMHESPRRGYLQHGNGNPVTAAQLARMTGCTTDEISSALSELETAEVYSRTKDGVIFSRRISADEQKRQLCSDAGKRGGGNPTFVAKPKGLRKGRPKDDPNSQKSYVSSYEETHTSSSIPPLPPADAGSGSESGQTPSAWIPGEPPSSQGVGGWGRLIARAYPRPGAGAAPANRAIERLMDESARGARTPSVLSIRDAGRWLLDRVKTYADSRLVREMKAAGPEHEQYIPAMVKWLGEETYDVDESAWDRPYVRGDGAAAKKGPDMDELRRRRAEREGSETA